MGSSPVTQSLGSFSRLDAPSAVSGSVLGFGSSVAIACGFPPIGCGTLARVRAAAYTRVSTTDQMSLSDQERAIRERAAREGWSLTDEDLYVDHGVSGALADRPALTALTGNLDRYDVLCVWSLDRLGRDLPQMLNNVQQLTSEGVEIVSLSDPVDLTSAAGEFQFNVGAAVAASLSISSLTSRWLPGTCNSPSNSSFSSAPG